MSSSAGNIILLNLADKFKVHEPEQSRSKAIVAVAGDIIQMVPPLTDKGEVDKPKLARLNLMTMEWEPDEEKQVFAATEQLNAIFERVEWWYSVHATTPPPVWSSALKILAEAYGNEFESTSTYALFQNALLTVAAHREEVLGRPPISTSSYALTYGAAETSSSSQLSSSGSTSGRSLSSGHKDTLKEAIRPVMKASSKHSFSQNFVEQAVSVTSPEFAVLKKLEADGVEESIRNWAAGKVGVPIIVRQCASQEESRLAVQSMPRLDKDGVNTQPFRFLMSSRKMVVQELLIEGLRAISSQDEDAIVEAPTGPRVPGQAAVMAADSTRFFPYPANMTASLKVVSSILSGKMDELCWDEMAAEIKSLTTAPLLKSTLIDAVRAEGAVQPFGGMSSVNLSMVLLPFAKRVFNTWYGLQSGFGWLLDKVAALRARARNNPRLIARVQQFQLTLSAELQELLINYNNGFIADPIIRFLDADFNVCKSALSDGLVQEYVKLVRGIEMGEAILDDHAPNPDGTPTRQTRLRVSSGASPPPPPVGSGTAKNGLPGTPWLPTGGGAGGGGGTIPMAWTRQQASGRSLSPPQFSQQQQQGAAQGSQQQIQQSGNPTWESHKAVHPDLDDRNYWVDISVLENVERLGTLRKGTAPEYALNRLLEYQKAVRASSPQDADYCTFYHVLKTKCNAHSHEQLHQVNMTAKQRQHILLAAGITHVAKF